MTVKNLIEVLEKCPPNMRAFTFNAQGKMVEVDHSEILSGDDEVWHEKQSEDVLLIS
jgi:hypothetical protein